MNNNNKGENMDTVTINGVEYVRKDSVKNEAQTLDGKPFVIVRSTTASPFFGYLESEDLVNKTVTLVQARRIYRWYGAATLSQLAESGTSQPDRKSTRLNSSHVKISY